jgi:hypothetical protein
MAKLELDYDTWQSDRDILPSRPGNSLGIGAVRDGFEVGKLGTVRASNRDALIGQTLQGVIELLAGAVEYLRWYGMDATEVRSRVKAYLATNKDSTSQRVLISVRKQETEIADGANIRHRLDPAKTLGQ